MIYFMVFWFSKEFLGFMSVDVYWRFDPISKFAGYMLIGYYIGNIKEISFRIKASCFIFFFVCFLITFLKHTSFRLKQVNLLKNITPIDHPML